MQRAFAVVGLIILMLVALHGSGSAQSGNLETYWIDVEGGAATLLVSPSGESMLVDTGFAQADRYAKRIYAAAQQAGLNRIDSLVISHFHADHVGGLAALAKTIPIGRFFDHGDTVDPADQARLDGYRAVASGKRTIVKPGDEIPAKGFRSLVVSSDEKLLAQPLEGGGPHPLCAIAAEMALSCPVNKSDAVTVYQTSRHGRIGDRTVNCYTDHFGNTTCN